jgi:enamine deaminase RidA (YjgF/YER057c/UK114 family)
MQYGSGQRPYDGLLAHPKSLTKPVRTTVRADLVADMRVEVTVVAYRAR